ncbi:class I SAM-dependent methyltransferase [Mesorhizobium sp. M00.F.Ca.ET.151.01.1.1]|uniref:class I SAM-dependent methyltransferase n=1 Tax=unclassified Mesorhizobium TaxID=325217 RepID=UPI000FD86E87|nr:MULTISPECIES: class I SAM-dependent methyltransferase [unclassified Mesorhizobium]TGR47508.1 class I SAM-dependent methyltransferase [bacterium M00.F.Ca.ET.199.01.1.1]TGU36959.1 class I SAM-dependent methyltransferase [bacterium M00.F.Ca.ET.156.01.1.1]TGU88764.1 class I SAM-dependent methyltransferase [Mesorhizobium sp. M00.F.Ca.ET.151.01.1.1]TGV88150.1 class I SAM-dependent methyltransferase [Mesorhizobium sp. M00.F.Ca.ET.149.01.1.1]TGR29218.1 class I SAM-dependent methyltransferase [Mesor
MQTVFDGQSLITAEAIAGGLRRGKPEHHGEAFETARAELALILQTTQQQVEQQKFPAEIVRRLLSLLNALRAKVHPDVWQALIPLVQNHPLQKYFLEDPLTHWSFTKPRGYSGDAQLLDYIYCDPHVAESVASASEIGKALYSHTQNVPSCVAARERRDLLTRYVDETAAKNGPETEVLAIAAGHLREANRSTALAEGRLKRWVALDQDPQSVGLIARDFQGTAVEAIDGSVRTVLTRSQKLGKFDLIYASGLYDYLQHNVAVKLTKTCLQMLKPNGTFLFANYAEGTPDAGYRETFMDWVLLLRSEVDMWNIINASVDRNTVEAQVYFGENRNVLYGVIQKRG